MRTRYYLDTMPRPPHLLRRTDSGEPPRDARWFDGEWLATTGVVEYWYGQNDWVEPIDEDEARRRFPDAV